jgi:hypothetical protein
MMSTQALAATVRRFAAATLDLDEAILNNPAWRYDRLPAYEDVRYAFLHTTLELRQLAVQLRLTRQQASPPSAAQLILAQHHAAFCDFEALLLGLDTTAYFAAPAPQEWPINVIVVHVHEVERFFLAAIVNALRHDTPQPLTRAEMAELVGEPVELDLHAPPVVEWSGFARVHELVQTHLAALTGEQLARRSPAWEPEPWPVVEFRLLRFEAHLREHANQLEKTLGWLDRRPNEAKLLLRQLYAALAEVEGICIGAPGLGEPAIAAQTALIEARLASLLHAVTQIREMTTAVQSLDAARIAALLAAEPGLARTRLPDGQSALLFVKYNGRGDIVEQLLASGLRLTLHEAAAVGEGERVRKLVAAWPQEIDEFGRDGFTPLQLACFFGHPACVRILLDAGADVAAVARNAMRIQPIHAAVAGRNAEIVRMLIDGGADVNAHQQDEFTPLMAARQNQDAAIEALLLAAGAR